MSNTRQTYDEAWDLYFKERYDESIALLKQMLAMDPNQPGALSLISINECLRGNHDDAKSDADRALALDPNLALAYTARGMNLDFQGKYIEARPDHDRALRISPEDWFSRARSASNYCNQDQVQQALKELDLIPANSPGAFYAHKTRGVILKRQNKNDEALLAFQKSKELKRNFVTPYVQRGIIYCEQCKYQEALAEFNQALEINPDQDGSLFRRGWCLANLKMNSEAVTAYTSYIQKKGEARSSNALNNRGNLYKAKGDYQKALADFNLAIQVDPQNKYPWSNRGELKSIQGDVSGAIENFLQALAIDPADHFSLEGLSLAYQKKGEHAKALVAKAHLGLNQPRPKWTYEDADTQYFSDTVYHHFNTVVLPDLKNNNERYVDYWEARLRWGTRQSQSIYQGTSSIVHEGKFGAGYIVLGEKNIWIVSIGELSKKFAKTTGLVGKFVLAALRNLDMTSTEKKDQVLCVPHSNLQSVNLKDGVFTVGIGNEQWEIYPWFGDVDQSLLAALTIARKDRVAELWEPLITPPTVKAAAKASSEDIYTQIEKLKKLLDMGAIRQEQYDAKVQDLLSRL